MNYTTYVDKVNNKNQQSLKIVKYVHKNSCGFVHTNKKSTNGEKGLTYQQMKIIIKLANPQMRIRKE